MNLTLFVSEMQTRGGVQSYMWHLLEALGDSSIPNPIRTLISFADTPSLLKDNRLSSLKSNGLKIHVSNRSIVGFVIQAVRSTPRGGYVLVGHPGQAPVAHGLKVFGLIRGYSVCLHGIEAWKRMKPSVRFALRAADKVVVTTPFTAAECNTWNNIPTEKFHTIPLSAGREFVPPALGFRLAGQFKVLFVGRQDKADLHKCFDLAFEATRALRDMGVPITLHMVGTGDNHHGLKQQAKYLMNGDADAIQFHGRLDEAQLSAAYQQCDVFLMPSLKEGFGIVFLEAMRCAKPCIGGKHGGTPYVIEEDVTGYLIPPNDLNKLLAKLQQLYQDVDLRERLGKSALAKFNSEFTFDRFRDNWVLFYSAHI